MKAPGLSASRQSILEALKEEGRMTTPQLAGRLGLNVETVREHLGTLTELGLVRREGSRAGGPGRPEIVYGLTSEAEGLFPRREGEVLRALAAYLQETGREDALRDFFARFIEERREGAMARVRDLEGRERLEEVVRILTELGFMARIEETGEGPKLRLCHCPIRELVKVSKIPCRAEIGFVTELLGERFQRVSYIPSGDLSCSYRKSS